MGILRRRAGLAGMVLGPAWLLLLPIAGCGRTGLLAEEATVEPGHDASTDSSADSSTDSGLHDDADAAPPGDDAAPGSEASSPSCESACRAGQTACDDGGLSSCTADDAGCGLWGPANACPASSTCVFAGGGASCRSIDIEPPRPIAPLSTSRVTSHRPTFHWVLTGQDDGAQVDVFRDRACTSLVTSFIAKGTRAAPAQPLAPGVYYWRLRGTEATLSGASAGPVWEFTVPVRDTPVDTSWGTRLDVDGDGLSDLAVSGSDSANPFTPGVAYVFPGTATGPSSTPSALLDSPRDYQALVRSAGDVNGDGFGDLLVGASDAASGNSGSVGAVFVHPGGAAWATTAPAMLPGPSTMLEFGASVQSAGDVDGDGYGDILVSAVTSADHARAYLYLGGPSGLAASPTVLEGGVLLTTTTASDINGDGLSDVVVGVTGKAGTNGGAIAVYLGTPQGLTTSPTVMPLTASPVTPDPFEVLIGNAGDLNGDGFGDIVVGLPEMGSDGRIDVYLGSASGLSTTPIVLPPVSPTPYPYWGSLVVGGGDVDGDGFDDLLVGTVTFQMPGAPAYVYRGGPSGVSTAPDATLHGPSGANFGSPVAFLGDVNRDGFDDVAVGSYSTGGPVYVFLGSPTGLRSTPIAVSPPANDPKFGASLARFTPPSCRGSSHG